MSPLKLLRIAPLAAIAMASGAQACFDGNDVTTYFSYQRPLRHGSTVMLRVTVANVEGSVVHAQLVGPFARLSSDGSVRIDLVAPLGGDDCIEMGPTDGPVYVIGTLIRTQSGMLSHEAMPTLSPPRRRVRGNAELDSYIVDPSYLQPAPERRHKGAQ